MLMLYRNVFQNTAQSIIHTIAQCGPSVWGNKHNTAPFSSWAKETRKEMKETINILLIAIFSADGSTSTSQRHQLHQCSSQMSHQMGRNESGINKNHDPHLGRAQNGPVIEINLKMRKTPPCLERKSNAIWKWTGMSF